MKSARVVSGASSIAGGVALRCMASYSRRGRFGRNSLYLSAMLGGGLVAVIVIEVES
jgi:hypothetical protein